MADVHAEVGAQQMPVACQGVQLRLTHRRAVAEVVEWLVPAKACARNKYPVTILHAACMRTHLGSFGKNEQMILTIKK